MDLNTEITKKAINQILENICNINSDVLVLQEIYVFKRTETNYGALKNELRKYKFKHFAHSKNMINMICSKYEFNNEELDLGRDPVIGLSRNALLCTFLRHRDLAFVGTHLDAFDEYGKTRTDQVNRILDKLQDPKYKGMNTIIAGDFNSLRKADYREEEWKYIVKY